MDSYQNALTTPHFSPAPVCGHLHVHASAPSLRALVRNAGYGPCRRAARKYQASAKSCATKKIPNPQR